MHQKRYRILEYKIKKGKAYVYLLRNIGVSMNNSNKIQIRTDLALETKESFSGTKVEIPGVLVNDKDEDGIKTTVVDIFTKEGAKLMRKPKGSYITLEIQEDILMNEPETVAKNMSHELKKLIKIKDETVLVVGLGNRNVTPDALGPVVIDRINVTRKIYNASGICAIVPGVMAQSGMESAEMIKGIVKEINAKYVIAIDSLAARNVKRLCTTIQ